MEYTKRARTSETTIKFQAIISELTFNSEFDFWIFLLVQNYSCVSCRVLNTYQRRNRQHRQWRHQHQWTWRRYQCHGWQQWWPMGWSIIFLKWLNLKALSINYKLNTILNFKYPKVIFISMGCLPDSGAGGEAWGGKDNTVHGGINF